MKILGRTRRIHLALRCHARQRQRSSSLSRRGSGGLSIRRVGDGLICLWENGKSAHIISCNISSNTESRNTSLARTSSKSSLSSCFMILSFSI